MSAFETANPYNRPGNGSAYDLMNQSAFQSAGFQSAQQNPQNVTQQQTPFYWQHQAGAPFGFQPQQTAFPIAFQAGPFQQGPTFQQPWQAFHPQQFAQAWQTPQTAWQAGIHQQPFAQFATGVTQPGTAPVFSTRTAELTVKVPVQRVIGRNIHEVQQYLVQVVLPVLLEALHKRSLTNEIGLTLNSDFRGECVAEIYI
jgi:hypothetical protein